MNVPELDLNFDQIIALARSALIQDARNAGEVLAAVSAEIAVDARAIYITLDAELWDEIAKAVTVRQLAKKLSLRIELEQSLGMLFLPNSTSLRSYTYVLGYLDDILST